MGAFHAYDIRGIYNVDFDKELAYKVAYFVPKLLGASKVLVGRDMRLSSDEIHEAVINGLMDAGADVYDLGLSSTPLVYFGTARFNFHASIQITASHNGKEYNGMKISRENALPVGFESGLKQIKEWIDSNEPTPVADSRGTIQQFDIKGEYINFLKQYKEDYSHLKIGMDLSNGMASLFIKEIYGDAPFYLFDELDGSFPNHEANPLIPENVVALQKLVINENCDIGIIFDGDADRVMFVDETGKFIQPDLIIALMGHYFLEKKGEKGIVIQDIRSSKSIGEYLSPLGGEMVTWRVGRAYAAPKLRELGGIYGGELAGHYYFRDFFYSDSGIMASMIVLNVVSEYKKQGISFSNLISKIKHYENSGEINFKIENKQAAMKAVCEYFMSKEQQTGYYDFDGYRVEFPDWWFNIRPSNTEPLLRFICEANSLELLEEKIAQTREILSKY